jgi:hypothetical protein
VLTLNLQYLEAPSDLQASNEGNAVTLSWLPPSNMANFVQYRIYWKISNSLWNLKAVTSDTTHTFNANVGREYHMFVNAQYQGGESDSTNVIDFMLTGNDDNSVPALVTRLDGAYPNPFNPSTTVSYSLAEPAAVRLTVYDLRGRVTSVLTNQEMAAGNHTVTWNGTDRESHRVGSGVYFLRFEANGRTLGVQKILMLK